MSLLEQLASDAVLDRAYAWLCKRRAHFPANADVWDFRWRWRQEKPRLQADLLHGRYRFEPLYRITLAEVGEVDVWRARDALLLKALALVLGKVLPASPRCTHLKGHGGAKWTVRQVRDHLGGNKFVLRTDVKDYYASIEHERVFAELLAALPDRRLAPLLWQYLRRVAERGGLFWEFKRGIALGCPLSPLIGAFYLHALDRRMERLGVFYLRFMDDIIVLSKTHRALRRAVARVNAVLAARGLEKAPDKTFIGRIARGFDYLGYRFGPKGLALAHKTLDNFAGRLTRLYEQERGRPRSGLALRVYGLRFARWAAAGLEDARFAYACARRVARALATVASAASPIPSNASEPGSGTASVMRISQVPI
jgi:hypothetical protein